MAALQSVSPCPPISETVRRRAQFRLLSALPYRPPAPVPTTRPLSQPASTRPTSSSRLPDKRWERAGAARYWGLYDRGSQLRLPPKVQRCANFLALRHDRTIPVQDFLQYGSYVQVLHNITSQYRCPLKNDCFELIYLQNPNFLQMSHKCIKTKNINKDQIWK